MNSATQQLSDYQRGVLNELGISCWKKQGDNTDSVQQAATQAEAKSQPSPLHTPRPEIASKEDALNKLQQLKTPQASVSYAGKVLCAFTPSADFSALVQDIIFALELSDYPVIALTPAELAQAKDYELAWQYGEQLALSARQLVTPQLSQLTNSSLKKQLWHLMQRQPAK